MAHGLRVGVVGYGRWGQKLARALTTLPNVELAGICDHKLGPGGHGLHVLRPLAPAYGTVESLLAHVKPDAVVVATPSSSHAAIAELALGRGLHVFVEKPLALSAVEAESVVRCAQINNKTLMIGHILHHDAAISIGYGLLHAGAIGEVKLCLAERTNVGSSDAMVGWWELGPHDVAVCRRVFQSEPRWVSARARGGCADASVGFAEGTARIRVGYGDQRARRMAWIGTEGALMLHDGAGGAQLRQAQISDQLLQRIRDEAWQGVSMAELWASLDLGLCCSTQVEIPNADALRGELAHFVFCALTGDAPISDGHEGLAVVRVLAAGEHSLRESQRIRVQSDDSTSVVTAAQFADRTLKSQA